MIALSATSTTLPVGGQWDISVAVLDADGAAAAVAPVVTVTLPDGTTAVPAVSAVVTGAYRAAYTVSAVGRYVASAVAAGYGAASFTAYVSAVTTDADMPDITDLDDYLGDHSWTDDQLQDALDAEAQAQRDVCAVPAAYPDSLRQALLRRAQCNLARRRLPLSLLQGDAEAGGNIVPGRDQEVRRFEAPYRKVVLG